MDDRQTGASRWVNVETIRYYQRRGLLEKPAKPLGGHRRYTTEQARRLRFIKRAQTLGFTLAEVGGLLHLNEGKACAETRALASHKLVLIEQKITDLATTRELLSGLVRQCDAVDGGTTCPIIEMLTQHKVI